MATLYGRGLSDAVTIVDQESRPVRRRRGVVLQTVLDGVEVLRKRRRYLVLPDLLVDDELKVDRPRGRRAATRVGPPFLRIYGGVSLGCLTDGGACRPRTSSRRWREAAREFAWPSVGSTRRASSRPSARHRGLDRDGPASTKGEPLYT